MGKTLTTLALIVGSTGNIKKKDEESSCATLVVVPAGIRMFATAGF
jgi:hypothetical protein